MTRQGFFYCIVVFFITLLSAQDKQAIIQSGKYYYGSGSSFVEQEARDKALEELTQQIAVHVAKSFEQKIKETGVKLEESVESILRTHSAATLKNVQMIKQPQADGQIEVFCYISKDEVSKIFNERKRLVYDMFQKARQYEELGNLAYALKLDYFALLLLNSVPDQNVVVENENLTLEIPEHINKIINEIRFIKIKDVILSPQEREITLQVQRNGQPVSLLDFTFWDGQNQQQVTARDGLATFHLFGPSVKFKELKLSVKYVYYDARDEFKIVEELWDLVEKPVFKSSVTLNLQDLMQKPQFLATVSKNWNLKLHFEGPIPVLNQIQKETVRFLNMLKEANTQKIKATYQHDTYLQKKMLNYLHYNHPKPLDREIEAQINKTPLGYELRRIRMLHEYPTLHKQSNEYLVLDFDHQGHLIDLNAAISKNIYQTFVKESQFGRDWKERQTIIKFVEKYRTSYLVRDLQTINLMFADDALIIVGRKLKRKKLPEDLKPKYMRFEKQPEYEYIRLTKEKYLQRLQRVFEAQQDIFLNYGSFRMIRKNNVKGVYGVEMRQSYQSTTYADEGYLFLLIDFRERDPLIYVRAWQPNEWSDSALVRTANFRIFK